MLKVEAVIAVFTSANDSGPCADITMVPPFPDPLVAALTCDPPVSDIGPPTTMLISPPAPAPFVLLEMTPPPRSVSEPATILTVPALPLPPTVSDDKPV